MGLEAGEGAAAGGDSLLAEAEERSLEGER